MSMTVGDRTVTVAGHYKDMTQESVADGMKVIVDGHEVLVTDDQLSVDGKTEMLEPDQDVRSMWPRTARCRSSWSAKAKGPPKRPPSKHRLWGRQPAITLVK